MDILQIFTQYGNSQIQKANESDYFQCVKIRDEFMGVYKFIKEFFCSDMRSINNLRNIFDQYYPILSDIVKQKDNKN